MKYKYKMSLAKPKPLAIHFNPSCKSRKGCSEDRRMETKKGGAGEARMRPQKKDEWQELTDDEVKYLQWLADEENTFELRTKILEDD